MQRILRGDFAIRFHNGKLYMKNMDGLPIEEIMSPIDAYIMSLYDGNRDEATIKAMSEKLCNQTSNGVKCYDIVQERYGHLLLPITSSLLKRTGTTITDWREIKGIRKYKEKILRRAMPVSMVWISTTRCLKKCQYCYLRDKINAQNEKAALTISDIEKIALQFFRIGVKEITVTGGEPLLCEDIYRKIKIFTDYSIIVYVITKMRINLKQIHNINCEKVFFCFSLDSYKEKNADELADTQGHYIDMLYNFKVCKDYGIPFSIMTTVTDKNINDIKEMIIWLQQFSPQFIKIAPYDSSFCYNENISLNSESYKAIKSEWMAFCIDNGYQVIFESNEEKELSCDVGRSKMVFDYQGRVVFCEKMVINKYFGSLLEKDILDIWNSDYYKSLNVAPPRKLFSGTECEFCERYEQCISKTSCIAKSYLRTNYYFSPLEEVLKRCGHFCQK